VEAVWQGSGNGLALEGGPGVHRVRISVEKTSRRLSFVNRLYLNDNQLATVPDCIGQLTNLIKYGFPFNI
jgi:Leucine-rich repeat (LRR) protein